MGRTRQGRPTVQLPYHSFLQLLAAIRSIAEPALQALCRSRQEVGVLRLCESANHVESPETRSPELDRGTPIPIERYKICLGGVVDMSGELGKDVMATSMLPSCLMNDDDDPPPQRMRIGVGRFQSEGLMSHNVVRVEFPPFFLRTEFNSGMLSPIRLAD